MPRGTRARGLDYSGGERRRRTDKSRSVARMTDGWCTEGQVRLSIFSPLEQQALLAVYLRVSFSSTLRLPAGIIVLAPRIALAFSSPRRRLKRLSKRFRCATLHAKPRGGRGAAVSTQIESEENNKVSTKSRQSLSSRSLSTARDFTIAIPSYLIITRFHQLGKDDR